MRRLFVLGAASLILVLVGAGVVLADGDDTKQIKLTTTDLTPVEHADASGTVKISRTYQEDHPKWSNWPVSISWAVKDVQCRDFGFGRQNGEDGGHVKFALYIYEEDRGSVRLTTFNTNCQDGSFESWMVLPDYTEDDLMREPVTFGVVLEADDGEVLPLVPVLIGSTEDPPLLP